MVNGIIMKNIILIIIGIFGMIGSIIYGVHIYKKEELGEYIFHDILGNFSKRRKMSRMVNMYKSGVLSSAKILQNSDKLSHNKSKSSLNIPEKAIIDTDSNDGEKTEIINVKYNSDDYSNDIKR